LLLYPFLIQPDRWLRSRSRGGMRRPPPRSRTGGSCAKPKTVGAHVVVVHPPRVQRPLNLLGIVPPVVRGEALSSHAAVERFHMGVVRRLARSAEVELLRVVIRPVVQRPRGELRPLIHGDHRGQRPRQRHRVQHRPHVLASEALPRLECDALPGMHVHHREDADRAAIRQDVVDESPSPSADRPPWSWTGPPDVPRSSCALDEPASASALPRCRAGRSACG